MGKWAGGQFLPTNMTTVIQMYKDFLNFEQPYWYIDLKRAASFHNGLIHIV